MCWSGGNGSGSTSRWSINAACGIQRINAELFQHGVAVPEAAIRSAVTRDRFLSDEVNLTPAGRQQMRVGCATLEASDVEAQTLKRDLQCFGHRQPACRALVEVNYGIGGLIAVAVWSELGDCRRFSRSEQVVRHTGLDVTLYASVRHRAHGYLSRQGPPTLRWALFEAAISASRRRSPDHAYYTTVKDRHDGKLAAIAVARQFARRCYHVLAQPRSRRRLRDAGLNTAGNDGRERPRNTRVSTAVSSCHRRARQPSGWTTALLYRHDRVPHHPWGTPKSRLLSPTTRCSSST